MPRTTPHYLLTFYQAGDLYSASNDLDRMIVTDNQLKTLSELVGDGVLSGWIIESAGPLQVSVTPGSGFITNVLHRTLTIKSGDLYDDSTNSILLQSRLLSGTGSFQLEVQGPFSSSTSATYVDTTAPSGPTSFSAVAASFELAYLYWDANLEDDFDHYEIQRDTNSSFSSAVTISTTSSNGVFPGSPLVDTGLSSETDYYYRIRAVDLSGNEGSYVTYSGFPTPITTPADTREPADATNLQLYSGNTQVSLSFDPSPSADVTKYIITVYLLDTDGSVLSSSEIDNGLSETSQVTGLVNGSTYRFRIQSVRKPGSTEIRSDGILAEAVPQTRVAPVSASTISSAPGIGSITLSWTASTSASGSSMGQKKNYRITVVPPGEPDSSPIDVGLAVTKTINSFNEATVVGAGVPGFFMDDIVYAFKLTTMDAFGNESGPILVKGSTTDVTPPSDARSFSGTAGDTTVLLEWKHSQSIDAIGYDIFYDSGSGYVPATGTLGLVGYVESFNVTGLPNGSPITFRIRTIDDASNSSTGVTTVATPEIDTEPPDIPAFIRASAGDEHLVLTWAGVEDEDLDHFIITRSAIVGDLDSNPNTDLELIPGSTVEMDVGSTTKLVDTGLTNSQVYLYNVKSVDLRGNESNPSGKVVAAPSEGINQSGPDRIESPENVSATFSGGKVVISWDFDDFGAMLVGGEWVFTVNTDAAPTAFNVYRSTDPLVGYLLIASTDSTERSYEDGNLIGNTLYYYKVTAIRDNADLLVDTGSVHPSNTVLLGTVVTSSGVITSITNSQRIVDNIEATLSEETLSRLLVHRHLISPINSVAVDALSLLSMVDVRDLSSIDRSEMDLSDDAESYYVKVEADNSGQIVDDNTLYVLSPNNIVYNVPFVGDYQILVNGERPTGTFVFDEDLNAIRFSEPLDSDDVVSVAGLGLTYYVPSRVDFRFRGYKVTINGSLATSALLDEELQTIRFITARNEQDTIQVEIEPSVPDFGTQVGPKQVNLSPDTVLNDFIAINDKTFVSDSGIFEDGDTAFVLIDGERTSLDHYIDFDDKSIIFDSAPPSGSQISLEVRNKEEVTDVLSSDRLLGLDASSFKSGEFLEPQLPDISHEGRVQEVAYPVFLEVLSTNGYSYQSPQGTIGTGTTTYAAYQYGNRSTYSLLLGTSRGLLRSLRGIFLSDGDDASVTDEIVGTSFSDADSPVQTARNAVLYSGRVDGGYYLKNNDGTLAERASRSGPCLTELDDGRVLLTGGYHEELRINVRDSFVYDPSTGEWAQVSSMSNGRRGHACALLPNGRVLVCGGNFSFFSGRIQTFSDAEIYNPILDTWTVVGSMSTARAMHSLTVIDPSVPLSDILVAGGRFYTNDPDDPSADYVVATSSDIDSAERFSQNSAIWSDTGSLSRSVSSHLSFADNGSVVIDGFETREIYDPTTEIWSNSDPVLVRRADLSFADLDGPVKQFFLDSTSALLAVTRNSIYESRDDGINFAKMNGTDYVNVVHKVEESGGTLYAATDLGVYSITQSLRDISTWSQGGLIGAGTTECFDLEPQGSTILAATEIGIFRSSDYAVSWQEVVELENVFNIETLGNNLFIQSNQDIYKSIDSGVTWEKVHTLSYIDSSTFMIARSPNDLFLGTSSGVYSSRNESSFSLLDFDENRDSRKNNVHMIFLLGNDLLISYDNIVYSVDAGLSASIVAEFSGTVPTVRVDGTELRSGFRYDTTNDNVVFETKRLSNNTISFSSNYSLYQLSGGGWYAQNPNAVVRIFVNKEEQNTGITTDARLGQVAFSSALDKHDQVTISVSGTSLRGEGELFHEEAEDKLEKEKGLPLSLGRNNSANLLQLGLGIEHNFLERGFDRDQYYCLTGSFVDRSFNSFWDKSEFYILGRREYDIFNSTIDYKKESEHSGIGTSALIPLSVIERSSTELLVGTDNGIFILDPSASFAVSGTINVGDESTVRHLTEFAGDVMASTNQGLFTISDDGGSYDDDKNEGNGLPDSIYVSSSLNNLLITGTDDTIYYSSSDVDPPFEVWFRADFVEAGTTTSVSVTGACTSIASRDGTVIASIGRSLFSSTSGKTWERIFQFDEEDEITINTMSFFAEMLFLGTNKGIYIDRGTVRTDTVKFRLEMIESTESSSMIHVNGMFASDSDLYVVGNSDKVYTRRSEAWSSTVLPVSATHSFIFTSGGRKVALSNNQVFVE